MKNEEKIKHGFCMKGFLIILMLVLGFGLGCDRREEKSKKKSAPIKVVKVSKDINKVDGSEMTIDEFTRALLGGTNLSLLEAKLGIPFKSDSNTLYFIKDGVVTVGERFVSVRDNDTDKDVVIYKRKLDSVY